MHLNLQLTIHSTGLLQVFTATQNSELFVIKEALLSGFNTKGSITLIYRFTDFMDQKALRALSIQNAIYSIHTYFNRSLFSVPDVNGRTDCGVIVWVSRS